MRVTYAGRNCFEFLLFLRHMQFVSRVFWDTKLELGNSNWIPVICADYYADNFVDCKLSAANEFSGIRSFSS